MTHVSASGVCIRTPPLRRRCGFSLVEMLVVIGIIGLLIAILLPALAKARAQANYIKCQSNLRQIGQAMIIYASNNAGWVFPPDDGKNGKDVAIDQRWFIFVLHPPRPLDPNDENIADWTPLIMHCPADMPDAGNDNSYALNHHLIEHSIRYSTKPPAGINPTDVVVMGEKQSTATDYYVQNYANDPDDPSSYDKEVEEHRHGVGLGSNCLYLDLHVANHGPVESEPGQYPDPWDLPGNATTLPTTGQ